LIIYQNSAIGFRDAVDNNQIVSDIEKQYISKFARRVGTAEKRSWNNSLKFMETVIRKSAVPDDCGVLIEYNIPTTSKRADFIISGQDDDNNNNFVIIELKQWDKAEATQKEDIVKSYVGSGNREMLHPSYQALSYKRYISDMNDAVYTNELNPYACAYLHNYVQKNPEPLLLPQYSEILSSTPIFFSGDNTRLWWSLLFSTHKTHRPPSDNAFIEGRF